MNQDRLIDDDQSDSEQNQMDHSSAENSSGSTKASKTSTTVVYRESTPKIVVDTTENTKPRVTSATPTKPVFHDVSKQLEDTLDGLRFNADLVQALNDATAACDRDFIVRIFNPAAERLFGMKSSEVIGSPLAKILEQTLVDPSQIPHYARAFTQNHHWHGRVRQYGAKRKKIYTESTATPLYNRENEIDGLVLISRDVTPLLRAERLAEEQTKFATSVLESLPGRTCILDSEGTVIATNRHYRDQGPTGAGEGTGPTVGSDYLTWASAEIDREAGERISGITGGFESESFHKEFSSVRRRRRMWTEIMVVPLSTESGGAVITHLDITSRKLTETALKRRATHDPLTGLPNRVLLTDRLSQALARASRSGQNVGVMFCDLDGFREVNNNYGHVVGDKLLVTIAKRLRAVCRSTDTVSRVSGDEFVIVLEDIQNQHEVEEVAKRVIDALSEPVLLDEVTIETGTSIGLVMSPGVSRAGVRTIEGIIRDSDTAMYVAKEGGRGRFVWFTPGMRNQHSDRPSFVKAIGRLIGR